MMWKIIAIALFAFITYCFGDVSYSNNFEEEKMQSCMP